MIKIEGVESFNDIVSLAIAQNRGKSNFIHKILSLYCDITDNPEMDKSINSKYTTFKRTFEIQTNIEEMENLEQLNFSLIHEIMHGFLGHFTRKAVVDATQRNKDITDLILDAQINEIIRKDIIDKIDNDFFENCGTFKTIERIAKENGINWRFDQSKLYNPIEELLEELTWLYEIQNEDNQQQQQPQNQFGEHDNNDGDGEGDGQEEGEGGMDEAEAEQMEASMKDLLDAVKEEVGENLAGSGAGVFDRIIKGLKQPKKTIMVPRIRRAINEISELVDIPTYTKYNKLNAVYNYRKKGNLFDEKPKVVIGIDVSYSIDNETCSRFLSLTKGIDAEMDLIYWADDKIEKEEIVRNFNPNRKRASITNKSGGTDVQCLYDCIEENYKGKVMLLVLTDMYFSDREIPKSVKGLYYFDSEDGNKIERNREKFYKDRLKHFKYTKMVEYV